MEETCGETQALAWRSPTMFCPDSDSIACQEMVDGPEKAAMECATPSGWRLMNVW